MREKAVVLTLHADVLNRCRVGAMILWEIEMKTCDLGEWVHQSSELQPIRVHGDLEHLRGCMIMYAGEIQPLLVNV